ncbi:MAG TPA: prolipoprotein diacylglyceryl transferase family protein [Planctomycetota bacterium]|nr:prolipoprotein diacylglyceryl transferase family protein [Planctomycetota bacterium]
MEGLIGAIQFFRFNVWSFAVPAAIIAGYWLALRRAREAGLDTKRFESSMEWGTGGGLVLSHMAEILFYQPQKLKSEGPLELLYFWDGLSSYGGFFGGVFVFAAYYAITTRRSWWREADCLIQGMVLAWIFGRFGCTVSGDHPGPRTTVPWAYPYPPPDGPRHNMGLYELLFTIGVLLPLNLWLHRKKPAVGSFVAMNCMVYGAGRFALDFMRATDRADSDPRYLGLTLAHYCSLSIFLLGLVVLILSRKGVLAARGASPSPASPSSSSTSA